ncbi:MAG: hypothetical protein WA160_14685 [Pseudobdellovibrio sp.]
MNSIIGVWVFVAIIYRGELLPKPNPNLNIIFEFSQDQTNKIYYKRNDEAGFCERKATYNYQNNTLVQKNTWVNPDNQPSCAQDADMQLGYESSVKAVVNEEQLYLDLLLGDEVLTYVWQKK